MPAGSSSVNKVLAIKSELEPASSSVELAGSSLNAHAELRGCLTRQNRQLHHNCDNADRFLRLTRATHKVPGEYARACTVALGDLDSLASFQFVRLRVIYYALDVRSANADPAVNG